MQSPNKEGIHSSLFPARKIPSSEHRRNEVLRLISENPGIATSELANQLGCAYSLLKRHTLQPLAIDGQIHSNPKDFWYLGKRNHEN